MKTLIKLALLFGILYSSLFASINEYKSDLYYANGIMINVSEKKARKKWRKTIFFLAKTHLDFKKLGKVSVSYNRSQGFFDDLFEVIRAKDK